MKKPLIVVISIILIAVLTSACEINMVSGSGKTRHRQPPGKRFYIGDLCRAG